MDPLIDDVKGTYFIIRSDGSPIQYSHLTQQKTRQGVVERWLTIGLVYNCDGSRVKKEFTRIRYSTRYSTAHSMAKN